MKFREKWKAIVPLNPDILIIQECENIDYKTTQIANLCDYNWIGENKNKGLGIFTFNNIQIIEKSYDSNYRYIAHFKINSSIISNIFAIWAMNNTEEVRKRYIAQVGNYLQIYGNRITNDSIIIGDFNSNSIWDNDKPLKQYTHSDVVGYLSNKQFISIYHELHSQKHGEESIKTFYMYRKDKLKFHIDYCFIHQNKLQDLKNFIIGKYEDWKQFSDHVPIIFDIK